MSPLAAEVGGAGVGLWGDRLILIRQAGASHSRWGVLPLQYGDMLSPSLIELHPVFVQCTPTRCYFTRHSVSLLAKTDFGGEKKGANGGR